MDINPNAKDVFFEFSPTEARSVPQSPPLAARLIQNYLVVFLPGKSEATDRVFSVTTIVDAIDVNTRIPKFKDARIVAGPVRKDGFVLIELRTGLRPREEIEREIVLGRVNISFAAAARLFTVLESRRRVSARLAAPSEPFSL